MSNNIINHDNVYAEIQNLMDNARNSVVKQVNTILIETYYEIGRIIVEEEQGHMDRAEYGKELIVNLSKRLT